MKHPLAPLNVFLVEDDGDDRFTFSMALSTIDEPAILTELMDGVELIDILGNPEAAKPDIIFLDLNMPRMNGFDCLKAISSSPEFDGVKIVILSTHANYESVFNAYEGGATFFAEKPSSIAELRSLIKKAIVSQWSERAPRNRKDFLLTP